VSRTIVIRVGTAEQARKELKGTLTGIVRGTWVKQRREIWFPSLARAAAILSEQRLVLLRIIAQRRPRSIPEIARLAGRPAKDVQSDLRVLTGAGLVDLVGTGAKQRPVAAFDRLQLAGDIDIARAAA
jgi:predicted transcriptional regulator